MDALSSLRRAVLFIACALTVLLACAGSASAAGRVIGGHKVGAADWQAHWRSMVSLGWSGSSGTSAHFCGGVLIGERTVLTARHCVEQDGFVIDPGLMLVRGGITSLDRRGGAVHVVAIERTPDAPGTWFETGGDLAILELGGPISGAQPIAVAGPDQAAWWGAGAGRATGVRLAGWGISRDADILHERDFGPIPSALQTAEMPVLSDAACAARDPKDPSLRLHLCAGTRENRRTARIEARSSCYGDSGGPLIASDPAGIEPDRLIGIVSRGTRLECSMGTSIFVNVAARSTWIQSMLVSQGDVLRDAGPLFTTTAADSFHAIYVAKAEGDTTDDSSTTYVAEFHPKGWRAWYELGRFTGGPGRAFFEMPPTREGTAAIRIVRLDAGGREQVMRMTSGVVHTPTDRHAPMPIRRLTARRHGSEHVLAWTPTRDDSDRVVGIEVDQRVVGTAKWHVEFIADCAECRAADRSTPMRSSHDVLLPGRREFRISAMDRAGNWSAWTYARER
jgi:secreted trypsin-like serine protease